VKKSLIISLFLVATAFFSMRAQAQVVVIANPSVKAADVSKNDLKDIFSGNASNLKDGSHVVPVLLKEGATHTEFLSAYIGKSDTAFRATWRSLVFSGQGAMPKTLDSEAAVVEYVAHNNGAIAYISKSTAHEGVKVLAVK
jgi:ABC-type phosphate transport system substrate-binding protein